MIIGIDCDYLDAYKYSYTSLEQYHQRQKSIAPFAGLFGVFSYETIHFFEQIPEKSQKQYDFPAFVFANAKAYLHYSKVNKVYSFYGDEQQYFHFLEEATVQENPTSPEVFYQLHTDLAQERAHFYQMVEKAKEYIRSGDIFQVVLSEQLSLESNLDSLDFYRYLSQANPSPYMFHFPTPFGDVVGSSPELVFELKGEQIFVAPIAGTRPRGKDANEDATLQMQLLSDEKELAEHKMLIDLARNDIGRVAKTRSVVVKNALNIVKYESVMHIISDVYGQREQGVSAFDVAASVFPAGTLSGTPKIRAMQIIGELETFKRNAYGGGVGFLHFNGDAQMAILIRSAVFTPFKLGEDEIPARNLGADASGEISKIFVQAGAGIVFDSDPQREYAEICHKRASVLNVFKNNCEEIK